MKVSEPINTVVIRIGMKVGIFRWVWVLLGEPDG